MKLSILLAAILMTTGISMPSHAASAKAQSFGPIGEIDPYDPDIETELRINDYFYGDGTDVNTYLEDDNLQGLTGGCYRESCAVWAYVSLSAQSITIFYNGERQGTWPVSTGVAGRSTPSFDTHPNGRIYDAYTSTKYPEGDYNGLGNMPYAVFISGGFAIHGTPQGNWKRLGRRASHGCVRVHPKVAYAFNRAVRQAGVRNTWITVE